LRHLFIVSRAHPWLYAHLLERFRDDPNVEVILDRRRGERRQDPSNRLPRDERRRRERRRRVAPEDDLGIRSHYIVEL
jgi:hypothetical protein